MLLLEANMSARDDPTDGSGHPAGERLSQAAAVRPTQKRDTSTVLDAAHVHRSVGLKLGVHTGIAITHRPRAKKGAVAA